MATDPDKENRHPNIVVHIPAAAATDERRRRRDQLFARLTDGRAPRDEADVTGIYNVVVQWASYDLHKYNIPLWREIILAAREFVLLVDEERAERDHREPGPLTG